MREEHCAFAVLNPYDRCIAICHHNTDNDYIEDCTGVSNEGEEDYRLAGREHQVAGGRKI